MVDVHGQKDDSRNSGPVLRMDALEEEVSGRLLEWRSKDEKSLSVSNTTAKGGKVKKRRRRKRERTESSQPSKPTSVENVRLPQPKASPDEVDAVLERALIKPSASSQWSDFSASSRAEKDLGRVTKSRAGAGGRRGGRRNGKNGNFAKEKEEESALRFVEQHRFEVGAFGSSGLDKRDKKAYRASQLLRLGCRAPRKQKMPIAILLGMRKKQKERDQKEKEKKREEGVLISSKRKKR